MGHHVRSLHARLLIVIILPLLIVVAAMTVARYYEARETSQKIYDNALISIAHVIARDVVLNSGDFIADRLLDTLTNALGDQVFYHIIGDNSPTLLSGYTPSPLPDSSKVKDLRMPVFFDDAFRGKPVRVVTFKEYFSSTNYEGWVTVTVWQNTNQRGNLSLNLAGRALLMMALMIIATGIIVWLGVNYGLKPLLDLQDAIEKRSPHDISPDQTCSAKRSIEAGRGDEQAIRQLRESFAEKDAFIANAAHQLRNPVAGILSQAEAAERTTDPEQMKQRISDVAEAARRAARLTQQLLAVERATKHSHAIQFKTFDINSLLREVLSRTAARALKQGVELSLQGAEQAVLVSGNATLLGEVFDNLLDNALRYGCPEGGEIQTTVLQDGKQVTLQIGDNGRGIPEALLPHVFERFTRGVEDGGDGCGLGLMIARSIVEKHGGTLTLTSNKHGTLAEVKLPLE